MSGILYVLVGFILGIMIVWLMTKGRNNSVMSSKLIEEKMAEKARNREKLMNYLSDKEKVANDEVEKLLGVSNATAERYLDELEKEGALRQVGRVGRKVYYKKV